MKTNETTQVAISYLLIAKNTPFLKEEIVDTMEDFVKNKNSEIGFLSTIFVNGETSEDIVASIDEKIISLEDKILLTSEENELLADLLKLKTMIGEMRAPIPETLLEEKMHYRISDKNSIFVTGFVDGNMIEEITQSAAEGKVEA